MSDEAGGGLPRRLMIEALVAAGPRKSAEEYRRGAKELCEDCAGYRAVGDFIIFWICDGTSNSIEMAKRPSHAGFSSRILAQDIGDGFAGVMADIVVNTKGVNPGIDLLKELFNTVAADWQKRLANYIAEVDNEGRLEYLLNAMPKMEGGSCLMDWSSTFLGGVYNERERTLSIVNIGDSGGVIIGEEAKLVTPNDTVVILFAKLSPGEELKIEVSAANMDFNWEHFLGVECFILMSDGVSRDLNLLLHELKEVNKETISEARSQLLMRGELSYDDQAVIVGRLMPE